MLLIPFFWDKTSTNWYKLGVFLCSGGRELWSVDDTDTDKDIKDMLVDNGFPLTRITRSQGVVFAEIDHTTLNLKEFYLWSEIDPQKSEQDVWRIYKIPSQLWACPVFKNQFWETSGLIETGLRTCCEVYIESVV